MVLGIIPPSRSMCESPGTGIKPEIRARNMTSVLYLKGKEEKSNPWYASVYYIP